MAKILSMVEYFRQIPNAIENYNGENEFLKSKVYTLS